MRKCFKRFLQVFYGVFTTTDNAIAGSAVCSFKLSDMFATFEDGPFKNQETVNSNWLPTSKSQIPDPRPGGNLIKLFSPSSLTKRPTKLEYLSLANLSILV
jgi:Sema domain